MHPDTEQYLSDLRNRLKREHTTWRRARRHAPSQCTGLTRLDLREQHLVRVRAHLRSLRDFPQAGRP